MVLGSCFIDPRYPVFFISLRLNADGEWQVASVPVAGRHRGSESDHRRLPLAGSHQRSGKGSSINEVTQFSIEECHAFQ